jgi:hypothetical protein
MTRDLVTTWRGVDYVDENADDRIYTSTGGRIADLPPEQRDAARAQALREQALYAPGRIR